ncbi:hypothetical protein FHW67_000775 [Herbaspirillum sp. Sphag1AN]|uniref:SpaN/EivJ family type III secretion system needle length determinant n=1 Tax=unclassified Herbaspirillum TaxID=2624150 RepID=UPI00161BB8E3|nr:MULTISPECIES: hypothetical protein [unclassified Herbaspirillum]MBB3211527.1 hypothetical protein [Herbaspirillum sp. Sphag1AN]MBB3245207.1 hypothetical protein [Herbaspirillum sp. Sphag64]
MVNVSGASFAQSNISSLLVADELKLIPTDKKVGERILESEKDEKKDDGREQILVVLQQLRPDEAELQSHAAIATANISTPPGRPDGVLGVDGSVLNSAMALKISSNSPKARDAHALRTHPIALGLESERMKLSGVDPVGTTKNKMDISGGAEAKSREQSLIQDIVMTESARSEPLGLKDKPLGHSVGREMTSEELHQGQLAGLNTGGRPEMSSAMLKSESVMMQPTIPQSSKAMAMASDAKADGTLLYKFRSWGSEHAVRIVPPAVMATDGASALLQPSSQLVEQRLNAYGGITDSGDRWQLREHRDATDEHKEQRSQREREEDDA